MRVYMKKGKNVAKTAKRAVDMPNELIALIRKLQIPD